MPADVTTALGCLGATTPLSEKAKRTAAAFTDRFGAAPSWMAAAPGRINVIGEHVDYCEGLVLPMAIDRHVIIAAGRSNEKSVQVFSQLTQEETVVPLDRPIERAAPTWSNYVRGVMRGFVDRGFSFPGLKILIDSDLPMGGGLSSSAALEVATATLLEAVAGKVLAPAEKALLCQKAEQEFAGVPCGIMDQFASVFGREGHLLLIDCRTQEVQPVELRDQSVTILVVNTNVQHELGNSEYPLRRARCEEAARRLGLSTLRDAKMEQLVAVAGQWPDLVFRCARHVIGEIERTRTAAEALRQGDWERAGELMYASHASLRDDFKVSCAELDCVVRLASELGKEAGIYGCRLTGGGFGGCCVALVRAEQAERIAATLRPRYMAEIGLSPTLFVSRPAAGARSLPTGR